MAVEAIREAARLMDIPIGMATAAVVGATGAIGQVCAELLAMEVERLYLIGRRQWVLEQLRERLQNHSRAELVISTKLDVLAQSQLILTSGRNTDKAEPSMRQGKKVAGVNK